MGKLVSFFEDTYGKFYGNYYRMVFENIVIIMVGIVKVFFMVIVYGVLDVYKVW